MKVEVKSQLNAVTNLVLGDVLYWKSAFYLIIEESAKGVIAKNFNGAKGLFGHYSTLENFNKAFVEFQSRNKFEPAITYPQNEYKLVLEAIK